MSRTVCGLLRLSLGSLRRSSSWSRISAGTAGFRAAPFQWRRALSAGYARYCRVPYRQASLTNIARHARATRADVTLTSTATALDLHVSDDGRGFDQATARKVCSYGLLGMSECARAT